MKHGFYNELDLLRQEYPDADFGFLENVVVTQDFNAFNFLHGRCDEFAASLSEVFGYEIECIRHFDEDDVSGRLIHAYCVSEIFGQKAYIDIRGITTDPELFFEEFENEATYYPEDGDLWDLDGPISFEHWPNKDALFDGDYEGWSDESIQQFIRLHNKNYDVPALKKNLNIRSFPMELNLPFVLKSLSHESLWKAGDSATFSFGEWNLTLRREEEKYKPYKFALVGQKVNTNETWGRRYVSMEKAYLHIINRFNENAYVKNRYNSLVDLVKYFIDRKPKNKPLNRGYSMDLKGLLSYFDFDYDIVPPGGKYEDKIRQELIEDKKLSPKDADKDLICLIDCQGANFGDIHKERYPISSDSVEKIIDRMNIYVLEFENEFREALEQRDIDPDNLSLEEMILECKALGVGTGEVSYILAEAVIAPETIFIKEVLEQQKSSQKGKESLADKIQAASARSEGIQSPDKMISKESEQIR